MNATNTSTLREEALLEIEAALAAFPFPFCISGQDERVLVASDAFRRHFGSAFEGVGRHLYAAEIKYADLIRDQMKAFGDIVDIDAAVAEEMAVYSAPGSLTQDILLNGAWARRSKSATEAGQVVSLAVPINELVEKARALETVKSDLEEQAMTDPLTGLPNRRALAEHLADIGGPFVDQDHEIAVFHIDLDKFKLVNDTFGHDAGDCVLTEAANILRSELRSTDFVARVGGDEFVLVCRSFGDDEAMASLAARIVERMKQPIYYGDDLCQIGTSIGIARWRDSGGPDRIVQDADIALYEAKRKGRGRFEFFHTTYRDRHSALQKRVVEVREAIALNAFEPMFQPQICTRTGTVIGLEAKARWCDRERGVLEPSTFLPAMEHANLTEELDAMILRKTLRAMQIWDDEGLDIPIVSINLNASRLVKDNIVSTLTWACDAADIARDRLGLEILEDVAMGDDIGLISRNVSALSRAGFHITLDHFGTGNASIAGLRSMAPRRIKIDPEFVVGISTDPELEIITGAMINLAGNLGIEVMCDGLASDDDLQALVDLGCCQFQGGHLGRAIARDRVAAWLDRFRDGQRLDGPDSLRLSA